METNHKPYTQEEYKDALDAVYNFHTRCYETVKEYLENHGTIEIDPDDYDEWRFDFLEYDETMTVDEICLDDDVYLVCFTQNGDQYIVDWEQINHDMVVTEKIMGMIFDDEK